MKTQQRRRKCPHCNELFVADYRQRRRQIYCSKPACQNARNRASQSAWLAKADNQNYFRDEQNAKRVRQWQKEHPGYWKNAARWAHAQNKSLKNRKLRQLSRIVPCKTCARCNCLCSWDLSPC